MVNWDTHPVGQFFEFKHIQDHAVLPIQNPTTPTALSAAMVNGLLQSREKLCRLIRYILNTNYLNLEVYLIYTFLFEQHMSSYLNFFFALEGKLKNNTPRKQLLTEANPRLPLVFQKVTFFYVNLLYWQYSLHYTKFLLNKMPAAAVSQ